MYQTHDDQGNGLRFIPSALVNVRKLQIYQCKHPYQVIEQKADIH